MDSTTRYAYALAVTSTVCLVLWSNPSLSGLGRVSSHLHYGGRLLLQQVVTRMGLRYSLTVTLFMVYTTTLIRFLIRFMPRQQRLWLLLQH